MGFVKTPVELARIQSALGDPHFFSAQMLSVEFLTRPETVRRLLPPGLEPVAEPIATAMIGRWGRSNCVHAFEGGSLNLVARHGEAVGAYCLAMPMSTDRAIIFGRELFGEPKKQARVELSRSGCRMRGRIERYGIPVLEIDATLEGESPAGESESNAFHYKFLPASDGRGLEFDPILVQATFRSVLTRIEHGRATLRLGHTAHDPYAEVEILQIRGVTYSEGDIYASARSIATVSRETFLPFAYGKVDDWTALDNEKEAPFGPITLP